ncbi:MAG: rhodanese-like domain-containing protein [Cyclobacteriaceae bacterium]|nr:rhodanese-like domain-containing protein [Cyclobacteriaceae bacterium]
MMKEISGPELKAKMDNGDDFQLIDVREDNERAFTNIGGEHIPMGQIVVNIAKISRDKEVVIYCRSGGRSGQVITFLEANHGFSNLINLKGGVLAWSDQVDSSVKKY